MMGSMKGNPVGLIEQKIETKKIADKSSSSATHTHTHSIAYNTKTNLQIFKMGKKTKRNIKNIPRVTS